MPRGPFAAGVFVCALVAASAWWLSKQGTVGSWIALALFAAVAWCCGAIILRRMRDAGISRWWLIAPAVWSLAAFLFFAYTYEPPPLVDNLSPGMKLLAILAVVPALLAAFAWAIAKIAAGLLAAAAVWAVFVVLLLFPGSAAQGVQ